MKSSLIGIEAMISVGDSERYYINTINDVAKNIATWRKKQEFVTTKLMLCVTELSEAMEAYRDDDKLHFNEEIADTFIRLLDICGTLKIDIAQEIVNKMGKNEQRPAKHGRKKGV